MICGNIQVSTFHTQMQGRGSSIYFFSKWFTLTHSLFMLSWLSSDVLSQYATDHFIGG